MKQQVTNFGRFYSAFRKLIIHGEPDETKRQLVSQYTAGRTDSLKEMTRKEYNDLCAAIEGMNGMRDELKRRRSIALKLMQELGVDTTDWAQINDFCRHPRISGKAFCQLSIKELTELATKLRTIKRKGWQRGKSLQGETSGSMTELTQVPETPQQRITYLINLAGTGKTSYN